MVSGKSKGSIIDEMVIVDTFTKLIFDAEAALDKTEATLIKLLGQVDSSLAGACQRDISEYMRAMGVDEMISVVGQVKRYYEQ